MKFFKIWIRILPFICKTVNFTPPFTYFRSLPNDFQQRVGSDLAAPTWSSNESVCSDLWSQGGQALPAGQEAERVSDWPRGCPTSISCYVFKVVLLAFGFRIRNNFWRIPILHSKGNADPGVYLFDTEWEEDFFLLFCPPWFLFLFL